MSAEPILFYCLAGICAISGVLVLLFKDIVRAAFSLMVCLASIAGLYGLLGSEFVAVTQIMIYAGGVMILFVFGIMLTNRIAGRSLMTSSQSIGIVTLTGLGFLAVVLIATSKFSFSPISSVKPTSIQDTGFSLMGTYSLPFEFSGILLLVCLIGAAYTASLLKKKSQ